MANTISQKSEDILKRLARSHNVLIVGSPGTGKSRILAEVAHAFVNAFDGGVVGSPVHDPGGPVPIPSAVSMSTVPNGFPASSKSDRVVFRTVFHQNSKHREFVSGMAPKTNLDQGQIGFEVVGGTLYRASQHAKSENTASLLLIDEINRGPAVELFGGSIVALEQDKRLRPDGSTALETQFFEMLDPETGALIEYALPHDLYILAAMNQADAAVEPLDVAFLRRWEPVVLEPDGEVLRNYYGLTKLQSEAELPATPTEKWHIFELSVRAWQVVNQKITLGRGDEFTIGHGVLMSSEGIVDLRLDETLVVVCIGWAKIRAHIGEVFFGDIRGVAEVLNATGMPSSNPLRLIETMFADDVRLILDGPKNFSEDNIYNALKAIAEV